MIQTEIVDGNQHWLNDRLSKLQEKGYTVKDIKVISNGTYLVIYETRKEAL